MNGREDTKEYKIVMTNRRNILIEGVQNVETFDDKEIVLETRMGVLVLKGQDLHIVQLNLEDEVFMAEGLCKSFDFTDEKRGIKGKSKGFIERLLK